MQPLPVLQVLESCPLTPTWMCLSACSLCGFLEHSPSISVVVTIQVLYRGLEGRIQDVCGFYEILNTHSQTNGELALSIKIPFHHDIYGYFLSQRQQ